MSCRDEIIRNAEKRIAEIELEIIEYSKIHPLTHRTNITNMHVTNLRMEQDRLHDSIRILNYREESCQIHGG